VIPVCSAVFSCPIAFESVTWSVEFAFGKSLSSWFSTMTVPVELRPISKGVPVAA
jgi:hypothetical protein